MTIYILRDDAVEALHTLHLGKGLVGSIRLQD